MITIGRPEAVAQLGEQPQDVVAVAGVERADRLVAEQQPRARRPAPGRSRPAAAGRRRSARAAGRAAPASRPTLASASSTRGRDLGPRSGRRGSSAPRRRSRATVRSGSSERSGSWKTSCTCPLRRSRLPRAAAQPGDLGARRTRPGPARGRTSPTTVLARVVLPEPVSPTRPTISPGQTFRFTPDSTWLARQPRPRTTSTPATSSSGARRPWPPSPGRSSGWPVSARPARRSRAAVVADAAASSGSVARTQRAWCRGQPAPGCRPAGRRRWPPGSARRTGSR